MVEFGRIAIRRRGIPAEINSDNVRSEEANKPIAKDTDSGEIESRKVVVQ